MAKSFYFPNVTLLVCPNLKLLVWFQGDKKIFPTVKFWEELLHV